MMPPIPLKDLEPTVSNETAMLIAIAIIVGSAIVTGLIRRIQRSVRSTTEGRNP